MELYDVIRGIVRGMVESMDTTDFRYATVVSAEPLELEIQASTLKVKEPVAVMTDAVRYKAVEIEGQTIVIHPGLASGDKVLVAKTNSGQNYIVLTKV